MNGPNSIETFSGTFIDLLNPQPEQVSIIDMAWALSRVPRYVGHTQGPLPYTVGQHSIAAYKLVRRLKYDTTGALWASFVNTVGDRGYVPEYINTAVLLHVLAHDGSEAYLMDLPTPLKRLPGMAETYGVYESGMMKTIWKALGLSEPDQFTEDVIRWADQYVLTVEVHNLIHSKGKDWTRLMPLSQFELDNFSPPWPSLTVFNEFRTLAQALANGVAERR